MTARHMLHFSKTPFQLGKLFCALLLCLSVSNFAAASDTAEREFSRKTGKAAVKVMALMQDKKYEDATAKLEALLEKSKLSAYERSTLLQMKGQAYFELTQTPLAIKAFENAISTGGLYPRDVHGLRVVIARLHIREGDYARGAEMVEQLERDGNTLNSSEVDLITTAWVQSGNYERALPWAERWFETANPKLPKHYNLLDFLYDTAEKTEKRLELNKVRVEKWPANRSAWQSLETLYVEMGQENEAFNVSKQIYDRGFMITQQDILYFVQQHAFYKSFGTAAEILDAKMQANRVGETPHNFVYLSQLYEKAGQLERSQFVFQKAVDLSDFETANSLKIDVTTHKPKRAVIKNTTRGMIPTFKIPNPRDRRNFKISVSDRDAQPIVRIPPISPKGMTNPGQCRVRFNVTKDGRPNSVTTTSCTEEGLSNAAVLSVLKWKYSPKIVDGKAVPRTGVETAVKFNRRNYVALTPSSE